MEWHLRLLSIQNQVWFYGYKDFFCEQLKIQSDLAKVFDSALEQFPELRGRLEFPLRPPQLPFHFKWIVYGQPDYPKEFYIMMDPPLVLTMVGEACWLQQSGLSVVGSREPTQESIQWIDEELGPFVESCRPILISGGARGIDQEVHALAIRKKTPTVVFLPSGLSHIYPRTLTEWIPQVIAAGGCFLSEYPFEQRIERRLFHHRNRLIAHLGVATLIVQAAEKSGTLMTGHLASAAGRPIWVVPQHPLKRLFRGNLQLLREGGELVCSAEDLSCFFESERRTKNEKSAHLDEVSCSTN